MVFAFDTLGYAKRLRDTGIPTIEAEAHAEAAREFIMTELVTKTDLEVVRRELETSIAHHVDRLEALIIHHVDRLEASISASRQESREAIVSVRRDMAAALKNLEDRITVKMGVMFATAIGILAAILKL